MAPSDSSDHSEQTTPAKRPALSLKTVIGPDVHPYVADLARLRIQVFRDFPYLYDGDMEYERGYIETYARSPGSVFVLACDGDHVVGAATGIPMNDETPEFKKPFEDFGYDPSTIFYFGESVLLPEYRGHGIGVEFFKERERQAMKVAGITECCFCAVERPLDHPLRPEGYQPLDEFWKNRGYRKVPELATRYRWKDIGDANETAKRMTFWLRAMA